MKSLKTISVIFGTRPEAIKLAPVILALQREKKIRCRVCVTAQHRHMLDQVLDTFGILPDVDLNLMRKNQGLTSFAARAMTSVGTYLAEEKPDMIVVQGDTTTVLAASLAAFHQHIPIAHVEAGLRTGNLQSPWPEELNRVLTSRMATLHFAPTPGNRKNLIDEGIPSNLITVTGNTVIDALFIALKIVKRTPPRIPGLPGYLQPGPLVKGGHTNIPVVLITGHRRENFGSGFENICEAISELGRRFPETHFVYPVHLNPNIREPVRRLLGCRNNHPGNIHLIEPLDYLSFVALMNRSTLILTDSGGVQEEAPSLGKPVLVMRDTTERPEAVKAGTVRLVGAVARNIIRETSALLTRPALYRKMSGAHNPYGDGHASRRIADTCLTFLAAP